MDWLRTHREPWRRARRSIGSHGSSFFLFRGTREAVVDVEVEEHHPRTGFDLAETDRLLTTTKQVRRRLDLTRPVPHETVLDCTEIANHAPMGGNLERNRWMIIDDPDTRAAIATRYADVSRPYLDSNADIVRDERAGRVVESGQFLVDHLVDVPALVLALRLDRPPPVDALGATAAYYGSALPGVWSFQLAARARGVGSAWTTFHLEHEAEIAELLDIPPTATQVCLLPVAYYTGDTFTPAPRRSVREVTFLNRWKQPVEPIESTASTDTMSPRAASKEQP